MNENNKDNEENEKGNEEVEQGSLGIGKEESISITKDMKKAYLGYAMSVIVSRALPDVRDGMKPVHRRILYSMHMLGIKAGGRYRKSAYIVGDVIAKYHPHGDSSIYGAMVRMAQDFSMRYELVDGQGNFGSIDGDNPAAMRYTEAKMQKISEEMLRDIGKDTVDFRDNYDGTRQEPCVLPTKIPALLLNGTIGIAVGMATNIPPHNITEICNASMHILKNPDVSLDDVIEFIKGPDFPTGGIIYDRNDIVNALRNGKGGIVIRGIANIEERKNGKFAIIISEIPYQVNKSVLIEKMADLVKNKIIVGITDIRDESNRVSLRIVIEINRKAYPKKILNQLYKLTQLQTRINYNMIALDEGGLQPKLFNVKQILEAFLDHRFEVVTRRITFECNEAEKRAHILEGLKIALDNIDEVIKTIRASANKEEASKNLQSKFKLSKIQSEAILAMPLRTLSGLERKKIEDELKEKLAFIKWCKEVLANPQKIKDIIHDDLKEIVKKYGDERKTKVMNSAVGDFSAIDTIPNKKVIITMTKKNYVKRTESDVFKSQGRGGKGVKSIDTKEDDFVLKTIFTSTHNTILFFTSLGRVFTLPAYEIPESSRISKGTPVVNFLELANNEVITEILDITANNGKTLFMCTKFGVVKKVSIDNFKNIRRNGLIAIKLKDDDCLYWVKMTNGSDEVIIISENGHCVRFDETKVRTMGRTARGVRGIRLKDDDKVVEMDVMSMEKKEKSKVFVIMENGLGKMSFLSKYRKTNRGTSGVKVSKITEKTGRIVSAKIIYKNVKGDIVIVSKNGTTIRTSMDKVPTIGRVAQGVILMRLKGKDKVSSISIFLEREEEKKDGELEIE